jgi:aldehyde:ferredoxin oxidoreductase
MSHPGYAGKIARIDLSRQQISEFATVDYAERFLGGRGIAAKIYWDETTAGTKALEPDNCLVFITGPLAGFTRLAGSRWQICAKSPEMEPEAFSFANLGGSWGAWLKFAGYDGIAVTGKASGPVYFYIDDENLEIRTADHLWGKTTIETENILQTEYGREARVLAIGPAAENKVSFATVLASDNASGSSGMGTVMGSKNLKAVVVKVERRKQPVAADPEKLEELRRLVHQLRTKNYENYGHETPSSGRLFACYGCISGCDRAMYADEGGKKFKSFCQASAVYVGPVMQYYGQNPAGQEVSRLATRLCDMYGLDTAVLSPLIEWLRLCYNAGIVSEEESGLPLSKIGSADFIEQLVKKISYREGFGDILAQGTIRASQILGKGSEKLVDAGVITRGGETRDYDPRLILINAMIYATEPRRAIQLLHATALPLKRWINWLEGFNDAFLTTDVLRHIAEKFWGSPAALDFSTVEGKALAAKKIQDYGYAKESLILCDLSWPIYQVQPPDFTVGPGTLESQCLSAITGRTISEGELLDFGERIFNLQRAVLIRQGWGGRSGDNLMDYLFHEPIKWTFFNPQLLVPDQEGKPVSRKGAVLAPNEFETMKDDYYRLRGWEVSSGLQTKNKLEELSLLDVAVELEKMGLIAQP